MSFMGLLGAVSGFADARVGRLNREEKAKQEAEEKAAERQFKLDLLNQRFANDLAVEDARFKRTLAVEDYKAKKQLELAKNDPYKAAIAEEAHARAKNLGLEADLKARCAEGDDAACEALRRLKPTSGRRDKKLTMAEFEKSVYGDSDSSDKLSSADIQKAKLMCTDEMGNIDRDCVRRILGGPQQGGMAQNPDTIVNSLIKYFQTQK